MTLSDTWTRPLAGRTSPSACTPGMPATRLAHGRGDRLRVLERARRELDVERDQQRPRSDQDAACSRVEARRTERRRDLAHVEASLQLCRAPSSKERRSSSLTDRSVKEDGQPEIVGHPPTECDRRGARERHPIRSERHDRDDVRGADTRMDPVVAAQIDQLGRPGDAVQQAFDDVLLLGDDGEHRAVVIRVRMDVEHAPAAPKRLRDGFDHRRVAALRDVRYGFEERHGSTLGGSG